MARLGQSLAISAEQGVLANDFAPDGNSLTARVASGPAHGTLAFEPDGAFAYTPDADFIGTDSFSYVASDGELDSGIGRVELIVRGSGDRLVAIRLKTFDVEGRPVDQVTVGEEFELRVFTEDLRTDPLGVFGMYTDIEYDSSLVAAAGEIAFGDTFDVIRHATHVSGLIDETGAVTTNYQTWKPIGAGEFLVFSQRFTAEQVGQVTFASNPADDLPAHDVLLFGIDQPIGPDEIDFGSVAFVNVPLQNIAFSTFSLQILAEGEDPMLAVDDLFVVPYQTANRLLDVVANDSAAVTAITAVAAGRGNVTIAADGKSLFYAAPADFAGNDRFTYTATDGSGNTVVATVDVRVKSPFQNFDRPTDTDGDGHVAPIDALYGINKLNRTGARRLTAADATIKGLSVFLDVNGDLRLSPVDILTIINALNRPSAVIAEGEAGPLQASDEGDANDELEEPVIIRSDLAAPSNAADTASWMTLERVPARRQRFFAGSVSYDGSLLDDDLLETLLQ